MLLIALNQSSVFALKTHNVEELQVDIQSHCVMLEDYATAQDRPLIGQPASQNTGAQHGENLPLYASSCIDNTRFWTWSASCALPGRLALVEEPLAP